MEDSSEDSSDSENYTESSDEEQVFTPYGERPGWEDLKPFPVDPNHEVLKIDYSFQFKNVHDYFRAIFRKNELSERALSITSECILLNPANSTMWSYRRKVLTHLKSDLTQEKKFVSSVILQSSKNYQVWQHRKWLVEMTNDPESEKNFTSQLFLMDSKNYHAWQHRQWVVSHFSLWNGELDFTKQLIDDDVQNNSAWNYRFFVVNGLNKLDDEIFLSDEVKFVVEKIEEYCNNESSWNYLRGLHSKVGYNKFDPVKKVCEKNDCVQSLTFRIDAIDQMLKAERQSDDKLIAEAMVLLDKLKSKVDPMREEYWSFLERQLKAKCKDPML